MAVRKPLTLIDGVISELPAGDTVSGASGGAATISQLTTDPVTPTAQSSWVLATQVAAVGSPLGLLLSLTQATNVYTYALRYRTLEGVTVGVPLT